VAPSMSKGKSTIEWVVFHPDQVQEARKIMKDLKGDSTIDAMGFGAFFEPISDQFFPGTSTLHTWLRYHVFVFSIIYSLHERKKPGVDAASEMTNLEYNLQRLLVKTSKDQKEKTGEDTMGIVGRNRGDQIKYWPSVLYWSSFNMLGVWGDTHVSREQVLRFIDRRKEGTIINDDEEQESSLDEDLYIDDELFQIAKDHVFEDIATGKLPKKLDFKLTRKEGQYFKQRYKDKFPDSLVRYLIDLNVGEIEPLDAVFRVEGLKNNKLIGLIEEAEKYSYLAQGGTYLYNSILCEYKNRTDSRNLNKTYLQDWLVNIDDLKDWDVDNLYKSLREYQDLKVDEKLVRFIRFIQKKFIEVRDAEKIISSIEVKAKVREREHEVKGNRSRFENSNISIPMTIFKDNGYQDYLYDYRWNVGKRNALDVIRGLNRKC
jgi:hypothetical protein